MRTPQAASSTTFLRGSVLPVRRISRIWSAQSASPSALLLSLTFAPWCGCRAPPAIRSCKPASAALWWLNRRLSLSPNLALGLQASCPLCLMHARAKEGRALSPGVRLPASDRTLAGGSTLPGRDQGKAPLNGSGVLGSLPWLFVAQQPAKSQTGRTAGGAVPGFHHHTQRTRDVW